MTSYKRTAPFLDCKKIRILKATKSREWDRERERKEREKKEREKKNIESDRKHGEKR